LWRIADLSARSVDVRFLEQQRQAFSSDMGAKLA
jgi:hypothetical protein